MIPTNFPIQTKHRTQMMITKSAKNTSSKNHNIYSQHSFNHTPKKDGVETTGFCYKLFTKKTKPTPIKYTPSPKTSRKSKTIPCSRQHVDLTVVTPRPEDLKSEIRSLANDLELKAALSGGKNRENWVKWR